METSHSFRFDNLSMLTDTLDDILDLQDSDISEEQTTTTTVHLDAIPAETQLTPKDTIVTANTYDSLQLSEELESQLEQYLRDVYGPTNERWVYLYKEKLNMIPEDNQPLLVLIDVQFVGNQLTEIAIAHRLQNFIFHRVYPTCQRTRDSNIFNRRFNAHNYRKEKRHNRSSIYRKNMDYVKQYCGCRGQNFHHSKRIFNDDNYFKSLPKGENVIYVIRGLNKKEFLEMFLEKYGLSAAIRTYPLHLTTKHDKYTTCFAHATPQGHCSVGNLTQMINYYKQCENFIV